MGRGVPQCVVSKIVVPQIGGGADRYHFPPGLSEAARSPHLEPSLARSDGTSQDAKVTFEADRKRKNKIPRNFMLSPPRPELAAITTRLIFL